MEKHIGREVDLGFADPMGGQPPDGTNGALWGAQLAPASPYNLPFAEVALDARALEANRVVAHDSSDRRGKAYDMLRTQVLQSMDAQKWKFIGVTSPTAGCGKTLTAVNLALSIARQRAVVLVDMDLQKPQVARRLGLSDEAGLLAVLEERSTLSEAILQARIGKYHLQVLPTEAAASASSEWMVSGPMRHLMQELRQDARAGVVIFDLPPVLTGDDVIAILPMMDCVLQVVAVGTTTVPEIEETQRYLHAANVVRIVVNKLPEWSKRYY